MDVELNAFITIFISEVASTLKIDFKILYQFNGSSQSLDFSQASILRSEKGYAILRKKRMSIIYLYAYLSVRVSTLAETDQRFDKLHRLTSAHWMRSAWIGDEKEESEMGIEDEEEGAADE
ncbi:hypothetical protein T02_16532 [Trichinella nativa]|uniref:Uncharacterized protein n=1 Tax=Trichinella nativa TaxID=6335 RepID=A0A0V1LSY0_9BILA|nr:hypothetical protein T02_16532 [Trichinella nativa]